MNEVYLVINGRKFPVHYLHLLAIAAHLPDGTHCRELAGALLALGVPSIAMVLIASSGALLTQDDLDALWAGGDPNIRRSLAAKPEFVEQLTDAQARDILAADNREVLKFLARRADLLFSDPAGRQGRLSPAMADALLEHIAGSPYP